MSLKIKQHHLSAAGEVPFQNFAAEDEVAWYRLAQAEPAAGNRPAQEAAMLSFGKLHKSTPVGLRKPEQAQEFTPQQLGNTDER